MRALVFSLDDAFVVPIKVLWHSLMQTQSVPTGLPIYILHEATLSYSSIADLRTYWEGSGFLVQFLNVSEIIPDDLPLKNGDHVSRAAYYRLYVASILPNSVESAVYMDSDMLAVGSLRDLFEIKVYKPVAAADHLSHSNALRLWVDTGGSYFQSGLLIIDLVAWRSAAIESRFLEIMKHKRDQIVWWDQDVLNLAFADNWQRLPIGYNFCASACIAVESDYVKLVPKLLHFDGSNKPWKGASSRPFASIWYEEYKSVFGRSFDLASVAPPVLRRLFTIIKIRIKLLILGIH